MNIQEIFKKFNSGEMRAHSELGTRDEAKQVKNFGTRIQKLKTVTGINARAMVMKEVVLKFNPFTCEVDDMYNEDRTFRPILLVSQTISGIKAFCAEHPEVAAKWEERLAHKFEGSEATMDDYLAFKKAGFIKLRLMSYPTVSLNFGGIQGFPELRAKYLVDGSKLNKGNTYDDIADAPPEHLAAIFFNAMLRPEADDIVRELTLQGANKETISTQRRAIYSKAPVSFVQPTNLMPFFFFPHNEEVKSFDPKNYKEVEQFMRYATYGATWSTAISEAMNNPVYDSDMDFFDLTIKTPTSTDINPSNGQVYKDTDSLELYQAMTVTNTDGRFSLTEGFTVVGDKKVKNDEAYASFRQTAKEYFVYSQEESTKENGETFEKIMALSNRFRPISSVMDRFLPACNEVFVRDFANSKYFEKARNANAKFFTMMNPDNALALAAEDEEDLEAAAAQQQTEVAALISDANSALGVSVGTDPADLQLELSPG